jgi:hypothetical protein
MVIIRLGPFHTGFLRIHGRSPRLDIIGGGNIISPFTVIRDGRKHNLGAPAVVHFVAQAGVKLLIPTGELAGLYPFFWIVACGIVPFSVFLFPLEERRSKASHAKPRLTQPELSPPFIFIQEFNCSCGVREHCVPTLSDLINLPTNRCRSPRKPILFLPGKAPERYCSVAFSLRECAGRSPTCKSLGRLEIVRGGPLFPEPGW